MSWPRLPGQTQGDDGGRCHPRLCIQGIRKPIAKHGPRRPRPTIDGGDIAIDVRPLFPSSQPREESRPEPGDIDSPDTLVGKRRGLARKHPAGRPGLGAEVSLRSGEPLADHSRHCRERWSCCLQVEVPRLYALVPEYQFAACRTRLLGKGGPEPTLYIPVWTVLQRYQETNEVAAWQQPQERLQVPKEETTGSPRCILGDISPSLRT